MTLLESNFGDEHAGHHQKRPQPAHGGHAGHHSAGRAQSPPGAHDGEKFYNLPWSSTISILLLKSRPLLRGDIVSLGRFVVIEESERNDDCSPGLPTTPKQFQVDLAADIGAALCMPSIAQTIALEQCALDEFVLWQSASWECFMQVAAKGWPEAQRRLRFHRVALLDDPPGENMERLELLQPAFSLPFAGRFGVSRGQIGGYIHGRKEIARLLELESAVVDETEHYQIIYAKPRLTAPQLIATYLRKYWEVLGE
jgi:hypothetical protein